MFETAAEILAASPKALFPGDEAAVRKAFRRFARDWHPDHNKSTDAASVLEHLVRARDRVLLRAYGPSVVLERADGSKFRMEYLTRRTCDGGTVFVGQSSVAYLIGQQNSDLADRAVARRWKFDSDDMKKEMTRFLPSFVREIELSDGRLLVYRRTPDQVLMSDLIAAEGAIVSPHVSWMITRMLNLACYLEWAGVSHLAIAPEFLLVSLEHHAVSLTGPALYAADLGQRPKAAPQRTMSAIPRLLQPSEMLDARVDLQLIRRTALDLMGDPSGNRIRSNPAIRQETVHWVTSAPAKTALEDYALWEASLGKRTFVQYPKSSSEVYDAIKEN